MARPRKNPEKEILVAKVSGVLHLEDGSEAIIRRGITRAHRGHGVVTAAPDWWEPIQVHYAFEAEPRVAA